MSREIELTKGHQALVDDEDFDWLSAHKWVSTTNGRKVRAGRWTRDESGKRRFLFLYREILSKHGLLDVSKPEVDHINGNSLDDRKANLRCCTRVENLRNRFGSSKSLTGVKGVSRNKANGNWNAQIGIGGKKIHLGCFNSITEAKKAYDDAEQKHFGDFAYAGDNCGNRV